MPLGAALRAAALAPARRGLAGWALPRLAAQVLPYRYARILGSPWVALAGAAALMLLRRGRGERNGERPRGRRRW